MLARSTKVQHPSGIELRTPLLVPSFSSKGFGFSAKHRSEAGPLLALAEEQLTDAVLLSAYDLAHKHVPYPRRAIPNITFVDSGGYETSDFQDLSTTFIHSYKPKPWNAKKLRQVLDAWPSRIPAVFVGLDQRGPVTLQAKEAAKLLKGYPDQLHALLVKPATKRAKHIAMADIVANIAQFKPFQLIGFTEKELGKSTLQRMVNISKLRIAMDEADLRRIPIHVFGSLDPITVLLYFISGAEVFDGLTWLRYGYSQGAAMYIQNSSARQNELHYQDDQVKVLNLRNNLGTLSQVTNQMRRFLTANDFAALTPNHDVIRSGYELLCTENPRAS